MFFTIIIFIAILGLLVLVHEFGHFIVAKKSGMVVHEFGFGFPPRLFGFYKSQGKWKLIFGHSKIKTENNTEQAGQAPLESTIYSINLLPLGGFVKIMGENNDEASDPRSFVNRPFWPRFFTLVAGVVMNVVLAWFLISIGYIIGLPAGVQDIADLPQNAQFKEVSLKISQVQENSPAFQAGLNALDQVVSVDGKNFTKPSDLRNYILENKGREFAFQIKRQEENLELKVKSRSEYGPNEGPTGIGLDLVGKLSYSPSVAFIEGFKTTGAQLVNITQGFYQLVSSKAGLSGLGGPVKIAKITGQVADLGFSYLIQFASFLSLNLAFLNILPFPALDGGRILFLIVEKIRGQKNNQKFEQWANTAGFALLLLLMLLVTIKDIRGI